MTTVNVFDETEGEMTVSLNFVKSYNVGERLK